MTTFTRKNAWNNGGTFENTDLLWYAKGVGAMMALPFKTTTSWWFFAAMHGQFLVDDFSPGTPPPTDYTNWANLQGPPNIPIPNPLPTPTNDPVFSDLIAQYWDQCQHGTWFFPPWHRGYIYALEKVLRELIHGLGGPSDWTLPYWNYFKTTGEANIPPAFTQPFLPDGTTPNPLLVKMRYGPFPLVFKVVIDAKGNTIEINQDCQKDTNFTGAGAMQGNTNHYGGAESGFDHSDSQYGDLEWNPHNFIHGAVGGQNAAGDMGGLMSNPGLAALDPIFYLHHSNIDRMWAAWNAVGNKNPTNKEWLKGPIADRQFCMPNPDGTVWNYTPGMVHEISLLNYTYDDLSLGVPHAGVSKISQRLSTLAAATVNAAPIINMATNIKSELVGASLAPLTVNATGGQTSVKLDSAGWNTVADSLVQASAANLPDEVYLVLEGIKGKEDSIVCAVYVNEQYAGPISLFGLRSASTKNTRHGGTGLTIRLDISKIVDQLHLSKAIDVTQLNVEIKPVNKIVAGNELTIERVSIYRTGQ